jgi:hypothetical protein
MKLVPFAKLILDSHLNVCEVTTRLNEYVMPYDWYDNLRHSSKLYFGKVSERDFRIWRIIKKGRNSFVPIVNGKIENYGTGSRIILTMQLHNGLMLFLLFILALGIYSIFKNHSADGLIFMLLMYLMTIFFFNDEYKKAKNDLRTILEGHIN